VSGGSWDYVYYKFEEVARRLTESREPLRRGLGKLVGEIAEALHDIEYLDSSDYGPGDDEKAIRKVLGPARALESVLAEAKEAQLALSKEIKAAGRGNGATGSKIPS